ncbi:MAG: hypothetical protein Q8P44_09650 [Dehalococcoidia bacterium]|nr:hypothetical protein [Dehalococcoidia bacterium]
MSNNIKTHKDLINALRKTEAMDNLIKCLEQEPVVLLGIICRNYEKTGQPVPDHQVHPSGYLGDVSLKSLISANMIKSLSGDHLALGRYEPTPEGLKVYKILVKEGVYSTAVKPNPPNKPEDNESKNGNQKEARGKKTPA